MFKKFLYIIVFILTFSQIGFGQSECRTILTEAGKLYDQGMFLDIPNMLTPCLETGFTRPQRIEAYKLIILAYLNDDDQFAAERMMNEFLKKFPEYQIMPNDPVEFIYLFESYKTKAIFSLSFLFGPNLSFQTEGEPHTNLSLSNGKEYSPGLGMNVGLGIGYNFNKTLRLNLEAIYGSYKHQIFEQGTYKGENEHQNVSEEGNTTNIEVIQNMSQVSIPLTFSFLFGSGNISYFLRAGGSLSFVNMTTADITTKDGEIASNSKNYDFSEIREPILYSSIVGGGLHIKVPRGFIIIDARANIGLNEMVMSRYANTAAIYQQSYIDSDMKLNYFSIGIGYNFSLYQSKKN